MKTYLLTFFIWMSCFSSLLAQAERSEDPLNDGALRMEEQQDSQSTSPLPINPENDYDRRSDGFQTKFMNMLVVLGLLIGFMILASYMLKRMMRSRVEQLNVASSIKVLEARPLSPRSTVYLLNVMGQGLLIAESHNGVAYLATVPLEEETENFPPPSPKERSREKFDVD